MPQAPSNLELWMADYARYWHQTHAVRSVAAQRGIKAVRPPKATDERLERLRRMGQFCRMQKLDPRRWLYALFAARRFAQAPPFEALRDEKAKVAYLDSERMRPYDEDVAFEGMHDAMARASFAAQTNVSILTERLKARYAELDMPVMCRTDRARTGGYHPRSAHCRLCRLASPCAEDVRQAMGDEVVEARRAQVAP